MLRDLPAEFLPAGAPRQGVGLEHRVSLLEHRVSLLEHRVSLLALRASLQDLVDSLALQVALPDFQVVLLVRPVPFPVGWPGSHLRRRRLPVLKDDCRC